MNSIPRRTKGVGSFLAGIVQCLFGSVLTIIFFITLMAQFSNPSEVSVVVVFIVFFAGGVLLLSRGVMNCSMFNLGQRIGGVMANKNRERLDLIAQVTKQDYTHLVRSLRRLSAKGYFPGGYVDLYRREFVVQGGGAVPPVTPGPTLLREVEEKSVLPIYFIAVAWLLYGLLMPMYRWPHLIAALVISVVVYAVTSRIVPPHVVIREEPRKVEPPPKPVSINTGNAELDEVLTTAMGYMAQLTALDVAITNPKIDKAVQDMVRICTQIIDYIKKTPNKVWQIRQFMNYYLPTTISLLQNYDEMSRQPVKGDNIKTAMGKIEDTMQTILKAFQKELDNLYQDKAMDISVDIEVMQSMMEEEGLTGDIMQPNKTE